MLKGLLLGLLSLFPLAFNGNSQNYPQKPDFLVQKSIIRSTLSDNFLTYYREDFRQNGTIAICDITYQSFKEMYDKFIALDKDDQNIVKTSADFEEGYTIGDSIQTLLTRFSPSIVPEEKTSLKQSNTIILVIVIAVFGMSTISVFFVFKNDKLID